MDYLAGIVPSDAIFEIGRDADVTMLTVPGGQQANVGEFRAWHARA